jgi:hypothetical protein
MKIILLCGVIGSGKDYYAKKYIEDNPNENVEILRFAEPIRQIAGYIYGFDHSNEVEYADFKEKNRNFLIDLGQGMKIAMGYDIFSKILCDKLKNESKTYIIPDFRFKEEFCALVYFFESKFTPTDDKKHELSVIFCNFKSDRYEIRYNEPTEYMAINFLSCGYNHGDLLHHSIK